MRYTIKSTDQFDKWLKKQSDRQAVRAIAIRIVRAEQGNFGEGVSEMRIFI
ncbi:addiction module killer protein [Marinospirillum minutulum]|uniref:addiction module killer protein n=1 Tax=Marinospirillum minutulum TaxID=64974 RepID=UPI0003F9F162|nr:addiction module killer protein [Marinospirillum minutulum]